MDVTLFVESYCLVDADISIDPGKCCEKVCIKETYKNVNVIVCPAIESLSRPFRFPLLVFSGGQGDSQ